MLLWRPKKTAAEVAVCAEGNTPGVKEALGAGHKGPRAQWAAAAQPTLRPGPRLMRGLSMRPV